MYKRIGLLATGVSALMVTSACGSAGGGGGGTGPIRIALMSIFSGAQYAKGGDNAFKMAVDQINASGGIKGRKIEYKEFDTDITPQGAQNATKLAVQYRPNVVIGYGVSAGLKASIGTLNSIGVPVIQGTLGAITSPSSLGSKMTFRLQLTTAQFAGGATDYMFNTLGVKSMLMINTQDSSPTEGAQTVLAAAKKAIVRIEHRAVPPTVTDLTEPVLAAKGMNANGIFEWGYATTDALTIKTAAANGYAGEIMTFSAGAAARSGLIPANLLTDKINSVPGTCAPNVLTNAEAQQFSAAYKAKYGTEVNDSINSNWYDAVYLFKEAVEKAGGTDPKAVADALATIDHKGVCGELKADANHNLLHTMPVIRYPGAKPTLAKLLENVQSPY